MLLVDDNKDLLIIAENFLAMEEPAFEVVTATSALEALQRMQDEQFDAVIADYDMKNSDMNGLDFLQRLRNIENYTPFVLFTGTWKEDVAIRALNLGANFFLKKEGQAKILYRKLAEILWNLIAERKIEDIFRKAKQNTASLTKT
ncbi:MAG: response regulator [Candidatus Heimdallarchaeota archaeon]